eukprot:TRINITY_DN12257_c0_g1_i2.p1 TRINITY_DN12257_c0_g1~~TRINITY_DN12257_c0_g1_i2.p1  ORF type:complete len:103 (+),score=21.10 TRINITY_DN12257_c0_g1_i2:69-377(+)
MYVRVKRKNQTVYCYTEPTETIAALTGKVAAIVAKPETDIRLLPPTAKSAEDALDLTKPVEKSGIEPKGILYMVYKTEKGWEDIEIQKFPTGPETTATPKTT